MDNFEMMVFHLGAAILCAVLAEKQQEKGKPIFVLLLCAFINGAFLIHDMSMIR